MNKKAFSLIELLAVVVILAILSTIVVISASLYIEQAEQTSYETLVKSIESSAELYIADHSSEYPQLEIEGSTFDIELSVLVADDYIEPDLIDERTGVSIPLTTKVNITVINKNKITVNFDF